MEEIKFRGKRVDNGEWVYGCLTVYKNGDCAITTEIERKVTHAIKGKDGITRLFYGIYAKTHDVVPETVGQYTGIKEIYRGDIYHMGDNQILYVVVWHDSGLIGKGIRSKNNYAGISAWKDRIEVIGNIYENPELIGGVEDGRNN